MMVVLETFETGLGDWSTSGGAVRNGASKYAGSYGVDCNSAGSMYPIITNSTLTGTYLDFVTMINFVSMSPGDTMFCQILFNGSGMVNNAFWSRTYSLGGGVWALNFYEYNDHLGLYHDWLGTVTVTAGIWHKIEYIVDLVAATITIKVDDGIKVNASTFVHTSPGFRQIEIGILSKPFAQQTYLDNIVTSLQPYRGGDIKIVDPSWIYTLDRQVPGSVAHEIRYLSFEVVWALIYVDPSDPNASPMRVYDGSVVKAVKYSSKVAR